MTYKLLLDNKKRKTFAKNEIEQKYFKICLRLNYQFKLNSVTKLAKKIRNSNITCIKTRCFITGRSRSIYKKFSISRIKFRELIFGGFMPGFKKSNW